LTPRLAAFVVTRLGGLKEGDVASIRILPGLRVSGEILTSNVRSIDTLACPISYPGAPVPFGTLYEVRAKRAALIGL
jgi:mRNA interferase MazF